MIHAYKIYTEKPDGVSVLKANEIINSWKNQHTPWTADPASHKLDVHRPNAEGTAPECFVGTVRFEFSEDASKLTQGIKYGLSGVVGWARIGYHKCDHDEDSGTGCSWDSSTEFGTVPDGVPEFL